MPSSTACDNFISLLAILIGDKGQGHLREEPEESNGGVGAACGRARSAPYKNNASTPV